MTDLLRQVMIIVLHTHIVRTETGRATGRQTDTKTNRQVTDCVGNWNISIS